MTPAFEIAIGIAFGAVLVIAGAGWIHFAILTARWREKVGMPWTLNPRKTIEGTLRFFSVTDPSDVDVDARAARAAARRVFDRAVRVSVAAAVVDSILLALLAIQG